MNKYKPNKKVKIQSKARKHVKRVICAIAIIATICGTYEGVQLYYKYKIDNNPHKSPQSENLYPQNSDNLSEDEKQKIDQQAKETEKQLNESYIDSIKNQINNDIESKLSNNSLKISDIKNMSIIQMHASNSNNKETFLEVLFLDQNSDFCSVRYDLTYTANNSITALHSLENITTLIPNASIMYTSYSQQSDIVEQKKPDIIFIGETFIFTEKSGKEYYATPIYSQIGEKIDSQNFFTPVTVCNFNNTTPIQEIEHALTSNNFETTFTNKDNIENLTNVQQQIDLYDNNSSMEQ